MDYPLIKIPNTLVICGPSQAGKTQILLNIVQNRQYIYDKPFDRIFLFYSAYQPIYEEFKKLGAVLSHGLPATESLHFTDGRYTLALFDDLMQDISKEEKFMEFIFRDVHHSKICPVILIQNLYFKNLRTMRMNTQTFIFTKNPSDSLAIQNFARQVFPKNSQYFLDAFRDATSKRFGYLLVDLGIHTPEHLRLRTNIFPNEWPVVVYSKKRINNLVAD